MQPASSALFGPADGVRHESRGSSAVSALGIPVIAAGVDGTGYADPTPPGASGGELAEDVLRGEPAVGEGAKDRDVPELQ